MKTLYLVRHAKSSWDYPELDDIDRPLSKRGKRNAPEMGKRLAAQNILPQLLITSPAKRALATARRIADEIGFPRESIKLDEKLYLASVEDIVAVIRKADEAAGSLMLFGHNPGFTDAANRLCGSDIYNIPTGGVVGIQFEVDSWADVVEGEGRFLFFDFPKKEE
jgi:phosphohistidine phosphatase